MGRINQLAEKTTLNSTDVIAVDAGAGGNTNKMTGANLAGQLKALGNYQDKLTFDTTPTASSTNPVTSGGVKTALDGKQNTLTFDTTPTAGSTNPVTSGGIATAIQQSTAISDITLTAGANMNISGLSAKKTGNIVTINGYVTANTAFGSSSVTICTIPSGARPTQYMRMSVALSTTGYLPPTGFGYMNIDNSNGTVNIVASSSNTSKVAYFSVAYITQN